MVRFIEYAFAAALVVAAFFMPWADDLWKNDEPTESVVKVKVGGGHGSGVHIGNGYVLTAAHVTDRATQGVHVTLEDQNGLEYPAEVLWSTPPPPTDNQLWDVALVRTTPAQAANFSQAVGVADLDCRTPELGEPVRVVGFPGKISLMSTFGRVSSLEAAMPSLPKAIINNFWREAYIIDAVVIGGNSGGPVFDRDGDILGLAVGHYGVPGAMFSIPVNDITFVVPSSAICGLLGRNVE